MNWLRRLAVAVFASVVVLSAGGCADTTSARDMFGGEPLATEDYPGLVLVHDSWWDGEAPGYMGKPSYVKVIRSFGAQSPGGLRRGFDALVAAAEKSGWAPDDGNSSALFSAHKHSPQGDAHLLIAISKLERPYLVIMSMQARTP